MVLPHRVWVNQPSRLQTYHELHGVRGLLMGTRFYFVDGPVISQEIDPGVCSLGWPETSRASREPATN